MSNQKFELVHTLTKTDDAHFLTKIRATRDIPRHNVKAGDLGGWVSSKHCLDQEGDAWIGGNAVVVNSRVFENALVTDHARVAGGSSISGRAWVCDGSIVGGESMLTDDAWMMDRSFATNGAGLTGGAILSGTTRLSGGHLNDSVRVVIRENKVTWIGYDHGLEDLAVYRSPDNNATVVSTTDYRGTPDDFLQSLDLRKSSALFIGRYKKVVRFMALLIEHG